MEAMESDHPTIAEIDKLRDLLLDWGGQNRNSIFARKYLGSSLNSILEILMSSME